MESIDRGKPHFVLLTVAWDSQEDLERAAKQAIARVPGARTAHVVYSDGFGNVVRPMWADDWNYPLGEPVYGLTRSGEPITDELVHRVEAEEVGRV